MYIDTSNTENGRVCLNALKADQLRTARTIKLTGDATGEVLFNGSKDVEIKTSISELSRIDQDIEGLGNNLTAKIAEKATKEHGIYYGYCETAASTKAKVVKLTQDTGFTFTTGTVLIVKFKSSNSASKPTLTVQNADGTVLAAAKSLMKYGTTAVSTSSTTTGWSSGAVCIFVYDGTYWVESYWSNTTYSQAALGQGYGTSTTSDATADKLVDLASYKQTVNGIVSIKFAGAVPADGSLTINSTTSRPIYHKGSPILSGVINAGDTATFIYNDEKYHLIAIDRFLVGGTGITINGNVINHSRSVTAKTKYKQNTAKPNLGETFKIVEPNFDAQGHITATQEATITLPNIEDDDVVLITKKTDNNYKISHGIMYGATTGLNADHRTVYTSENTTTEIDGSGASGTIKIPQLIVDSLGHVSQASDQSIEIKMPTDTGMTSVEVSGSGNAITAATYNKSNRKLTLTKGATYNNYVLPTATSSVLGGIKSSAAITVNSDGNVSELKEAYLVWGNKALSGSVSPVDAAASDIHSANRFQFANPAGITVQYSRDGTNFSDYGATDEEKIKLVSGLGAHFQIGKRSGVSNSTAVNTVNDKVRITLHAANMQVYTRLRKLLINITTNSAKGCKVLIERSLIGSETTFGTLGTYDITGWSGWNSIPINNAFGGNPTQTTQIAALRLTFYITTLAAGKNNGLEILDIAAIGDVFWTTPSNMARTSHLYSWDYQQNASFPKGISSSGNLSATGNLTIGGDASITKDLSVGEEISAKVIGATEQIAVGSASMTSNGYVSSTWLQTTSATDTSSYDNIAVIDSQGWIYKRSKANAFKDLLAAEGTLGLNAATDVPLRISSDSATDSYIRFTNNSGTALGSYGFNGANKPVVYVNSKVNTIYHSGNLTLSSLGITISKEEINHLDGISGNVQGLLNNKLGKSETAAAATKLATARQIKLTGDVTGEASFNGTADCSIEATVADDSHYHDAANINKGTLGTARGGTGNTSYTASRALYTNTATKFATSNHFMNASKLAVNSTSEPSTALHVAGDANITGTIALNNKVKFSYNSTDKCVDIIFS